jgi:uncharacterized protein YjbI with pentapeptide repeats
MAIFLTAEKSVAVVANDISVNAVSGDRAVPSNPDAIKAQERKLQEVIAGTIMRSGVVYPKHRPLPQIELDREFLRQNRPATNPAEIAELIKGLQSGDPDAIANFEQHMASYLAAGNGNRGKQIMDALNGVIDNPNAYKLNRGYAQSLLDRAFDAFVGMDHNSKADLDFSRINLDGRYIAGLDLRKTGLGTAQLSDFTDWANTNVSGLNLNGVDFTAKNTGGTIFRGSDLSNTTWGNKDMSSNNFTRANLSGADLAGANLAGNQTMGRANFSGANLTGATAGGGMFRDANLQNAILTDADFSNTDLRGARLSGANTTGTNFNGAQTGPSIGDCWGIA